MKRIMLALLVVSMVFSASCKSQPTSLTNEEIDEISIPLIEEALGVYDKVMGLFLEIDNESITENGINYFKVKNINSKAELWSLINSVYTAEAGNRIFKDNVDGSEAYTAKFIEKDGSLYKSQTIPLVGSDSYPLKSVTPLERKDGAFCVLADFHYTFAKLYFVKTEEGWRLENSVHEGEKEYLNSVENKTDSIIKLIEKDTLMVDYFRTADTADLISEDEAKKIFIPLFERSYNVYHNYVKNAPQFNMGDYTSPDFKVGRSEYDFVEFPELKTLSDVWESIYGAYTKASAGRLFHYNLDGNNEEARYVERDGKLYYQNSGHGNSVEYDMSSLKLIEQCENTLVFTLDEYVMDDFETQRIFVLEKSALGWRMSNGFDENVALTDSRYELQMQSIGEAKVFSVAPKNQEVFPATFKTASQTITLNPPIFTGIKVQNAYTYKRHFAFQSSQVVISVLAKYNETNNVTKNILLDKRANVVDDSFNHSSAVKNIEAISKYPEGVQVIQRGEEGAYKQYLATTDGQALSENFDEIGFFYKGIALARRGNKLGFISENGETLLEPSIEIDDLKYSPDYTRGFQAKYMTEDAFVVPIGGELAIITLDRRDNFEQLTFEVPEDFSKAPYSEAKLTPTDEFTWGEYMPFVVYTKDNKDDPIPIFALLGEGVSTLDEGHKVYERLNDLYLTSYPVPDGDYDGVSYNEERIKDYLFSSSIINMSQDLKRLEVWRVVDFKNSKSELDVYVDGKCVDTTYYDTWYRTNARVREESTSVNTAFDTLQATRRYDHIGNKQIYQIRDKSRVFYEVVFNLKENYNVTLNQIIDETHLLVTFASIDFVINSSNPNDNGVNRNTYVLDAENETLTKIENYISSPLLSPDRKYLIYSSFRDRNASANPPDNWAYVMKEGFYVKNLENGETAFYSFDCDWNPAHDAISWISKEAYENAVNN